MSSDSANISPGTFAGDDSSALPAPHETSPHASGAKRARLIGGLCLVFLLLGGIWSGYWFFCLRTVESTDDVYVGGNLVRIFSRLAATEIYWLSSLTFLALIGIILLARPGGRGKAVNAGTGKQIHSGTQP
ncbi:MAG: hypothetical protein LBQ51_02440 [Desulfovibrio sp.]|jgi:hypothetical protein|nr:hypothetical protein [Desulfovibrio sp.]